MEWKIGEIFEFGSEWYQCVIQPELQREQTACGICSMNFDGKCPIPMEECASSYRCDKTSVIFKKLEKVGEPYTHYCPSGRIIYFQRYKIFNKLYSHNTEYIMCDFNEDSIVSIEIKQTKGDMEEKKLNLKPFNIQKAREGKPVCTRDGRKARIICFDAKGDPCPIIALVEENNIESAYRYDKNGQNAYKKSELDLMMLPEKRSGWVNVYKDSVYDTKDKALIGRVESGDYIDTIKVSWEE